MSLAERVDALERSMCRWRRTALGLCVTLVVFGTVAATQEEEVPDLVKARRFEVVDKAGTVVVCLRSWEQGGWLSVCNKKGSTTTRVAQNDGGGGILQILSKKEEAVINVGESNGTGLIHVCAGGKPVVTAGAQKSEDGGMIEVLNKTGEAVVSLAADEYGNGVVGAWDRKGKGRTLRPGR